MNNWTLNQIEEDFADLHGSVYYNDIIDERRDAFRDAIRVEQAQAFAIGVHWAQKALAGEDSVTWARSAHHSSVNLAHAMGLLDDVIDHNPYEENEDD